ncbi:PilC/PilY family type IV pilus protein [Xanthomonas campestris pv. plantaginis]|uniref:pilus assembly protein n=1 Tax=Xanthomonas campestris TaxID=339 RepID=UPI002B23247D|nr:PilC/PilY family type IV pilus protein [Xanthomonas campestris]MEA9608113.1 PilC/PilY family type IV pilus protein [Xanthomonas campestris pv. plantaginis]
MNACSSPSLRRSALAEQLRCACMALAATLAAAPAGAVNLPDEPLQSSGRVSPNILFILDDSGSMSEDSMPDVLPGTTPINIAELAYSRNTIYYNPAFDYRPWLNPDGSQMTGGVNYSNVYTDDSFLTGAGNLQSAVRTFFVPKDLNASVAQLANVSSYWRYQIHTDGRIVRSEYLRNVQGQQGLAGRDCSSSGFDWQWKNCTFSLPNPARNSEAAERANFAIWYSYYRTRMKVAKASAGQAFADLNTSARVGFRTIWRRNKTGNLITQDNPIPIGRNDGLFDDPNGGSGANNNKTLWYDRLYGAAGSGATPLHGALTDAGLYYGNAAANGPYGPQVGSAQFSCRQNFTILTTDGYWNGKDNYADIANEQDNVAGQTITSTTRDTYTYRPERPYASSDSDTLADVAMRFWKNDLRADLANNVPTSSRDPGFWQHMVTYAISIGASGTLNPETDLPALTAGTLNWPTPRNNTIVNVDDLWHASVNGRGDFIVASNPNEFTQALKASLASIIERAGAFSNLSANSTRVDSDTLAFQASFVSGVWSGQLRAFPVTAAGTSATASWNASAGIPTTGRKIFTFNGLTGATFPTATQLLSLARTAAPAVSGADNAAYIAGARNQELANGGTLRNRTSALGDIVGSSPVFDAQTNTVYVGANDGMLHAVDASDGTEEFAYIPAAVSFPDLNTLSKPDYEHRYFVDGPVILSRRDQTPGATILVGTLGRGGKGLYSLDVTNPTTFSAARVQWERTETPLSNMGLILGQPIIARLNNGDMGLIVPNGVNSTNNRAALLIYRLSDGALLAEIDTGVGSATSPNGMSAPTIRDVDGNGTADFVYAGDMLGNMWKFDISSATRTAWSTASNRLRMFTATSPTGQVQPITSSPVVARDPSTFQLWVFFGTGRFMETGDTADRSVQTFYGLKDGTTSIAKSALQQRTVAAVETDVDTGRTVRAFEAPSVLPAGRSGWYIDLVNPPTPPGTPIGERVVSDPQVVNDVLNFSSIIPSSDPCLPGGTGFQNALNAFTGASLSESFFDIDGDGSFSDETVSVGGGGGSTGTPVATGSVGLGGMGGTGNILTGGGAGPGGPPGLLCTNLSNATVECQRIREARRTSRVSWRELLKEM